MKSSGYGWSIKKVGLVTYFLLPILIGVAVGIFVSNAVMAHNTFWGIGAGALAFIILALIMVCIEIKNTPKSDE